MTAPKKAPDTDGNLPEARRLLDAAISALVDPKPHTVHRENRTTEITWLDSLYDHLLDAVAGQSGERSGGQSSIPVWADVLDLLHRIESDTRKWQPAEQAEFIGPLRPGWCRLDVDEPPTITRLAAIQARGWRPQDVADIMRIVGKIELWCDEIRAKLSPEPVIYLMAPNTSGAAACTACGTQYVYRRDTSDNNRPVRQPALKVTKEGCRCQYCHASWEPGQLRLLAAALGYPLPAGVLE